MSATKHETRSMAQRVLTGLGVSSALVLLAVHADRRLGDDGRHAALRSGPSVPPVRRVKPVTPPWPEALVTAGDIVPPEFAPDAAPLPVRRDGELARAFLLRAASVQEPETRTALADRPAAASRQQASPVSD